VRWQKLTVLAQAALTVIILCAAALIGISFRNLARVPGGFVPEDRVVARIQLADTEYPSHEARAVFTEQLLDNLLLEPELTAAGFTSTLPVGDLPRGGRFQIQLEDGSLTTEPQLFHYRRISANYPDVLGIPIVRGRAFERRDDTAHPSVAIVSQALAEQVWPGADPIGKRIYRLVASNPEPQPLEIVGVVGNVLDGGFDAPASATVYVPYAQVSLGRISIVATPRTTQEAALEAVRRALRATDPRVAASAPATLESLVNRANALPRLQTILLVIFAVVATGIVALGSYGVMSQLVGSRERELAVRLVFGAAPAHLGLSVLLEAGKLTVPGIVLGLAASWLLSGALEPFVFGIDPRSSSITVLVGSGTLALVACASIAPAIRAMRMDVRKGFSVG
jgi:putative ABC transport system permease protein